MEARYIGPKLTSLVPEAAIVATERACHRLAEDVQGRMLDVAQAETPVRTGAVRDSWLAPMIEHRGNRYEAKIKNGHWLAHLLEYGTKAHEIRPEDKRAELTPQGPRAGAHVAGIHGHHMAARAAQVAEAELPFTGDRVLHEWKDEVEAAMLEASKGA